jgi:DivIVA domain-containing protein
LFAAAVVATRGGGELADAPPDAADVGLPDGPLRASDVEALRFPLAVRGYRMAEVDAALERLADELAARDRLIADLADGAEGPLRGRHVAAEPPEGPAGVPPRAAGDWPT